LPGLTGYEIAAIARKTLRSPGALVALTGYGRAEDHEAVLAAGSTIIS
jgi:CheY-like chemotaxis protein